MSVYLIFLGIIGTICGILGVTQHGLIDYILLLKNAPADSALEMVNLAPSIEKLLSLLNTHSLLEDEKAWVDRPVYTNITQSRTGDTYTNAIEAAIADIEEELRANPTRTITPKQASSLLERYFAPVTDEVSIILFNKTEFYPTSGSRLEQSLEALAEKAKSSAVHDAEQLASIYDAAIDALLSFSFLKRRLKSTLPPLIATVYSKSDIARVIESTYDYLQTGQGSAKNIYDRTYNWNISLERGKSSLIGIQHPVIVPGGRFTEFYYWDSLWIIKGLAAAGKLNHVRDQLNSFFALVDCFGFIPNGSRKYYLDRSQPPVLAMGVDVLYSALASLNLDKANEFLEQALPRLLQEYLGFWMNPLTGHVVSLDPSKSFNSSRHVIASILSETAPILNRYYSTLTNPRPESFTRDMHIYRLAKELVNKGGHIAAGSPEEMMQAIRAAAESGWDFSFRWSRKFFSKNTEKEEINDEILKNDNSFSVEEKSLLEFFASIDTTNIIPVDLNIFLFQTEVVMSKFFSLYHARTLSEETKAQCLALSLIFKNVALARQRKMQEFLWNATDMVWKDWDLREKTQSKIVTAASLTPYWIDGFSSSGTIHKDLLLGWGIVGTKFHSGQQWDAPNVWAPLLDFATSDKLYKNREASSHVNITNALETNSSVPLVAKNFIKAACVSHKINKNAGAEGFFFEKYNALHYGSGGDGGEYVNQVGFGWTNGLVIELVARFGADLLLSTASA